MLWRYGHAFMPLFRSTIAYELCVLVLVCVCVGWGAWAGTLVMLISSALSGFDD